MTSVKKSANPPTWQIIVGVVFGFVFVSAVLVLVIILQDLNAQQYAIVKTVLALAASGIAGVFTGFIEIEGRISKVAVRAGGALAVFVIVFFFTPKQPEPLPEDPQTPDVIHMHSSGDNATQVGVIEGDFNANSNSTEKDGD